MNGPWASAQPNHHFLDEFQAQRTQGDPTLPIIHWLPSATVLGPGPLGACSGPSGPSSRGEGPIGQALLVPVLLPQLHVVPYWVLALLAHHLLQEWGTGQVHMDQRP